MIKRVEDYMRQLLKNNNEIVELITIVELLCEMIHELFEANNLQRYEVSACFKFIDSVNLIFQLELSFLLVVEKKKKEDKSNLSNTKSEKCKHNEKEDFDNVLII